MGVGEWFADFCSELKIDSAKRSSIAYRTGRIVGQLNTDFRGQNSDTANRFYVGSYGRNTAIPSVSDVDLLYELPSVLYSQYNAYLGNGQSALLGSVRNSIQKTYGSSAIAGDGQVVVIRFTDGVRFEVLPARRTHVRRLEQRGFLAGLQAEAGDADLRYATRCMQSKPC
jgi:hypothetical protein